MPCRYCNTCRAGIAGKATQINQLHSSIFFGGKEREKYGLL